MTRRELLALPLFLQLLGACGGGLQLTVVDAAASKPSNVAVFFTVDTADGEPVADLLAGDFTISEDGVRVSVDESRQTIISPKVAAEHYALLLVDMSASVTESDQVAEIARASSEFVDQVGEVQRVAVYAFDGSAELHQIMPFASSEKAAGPGLNRLQQFRTRDPSTNLHGAIVQAAELLDDALQDARTPLRFGTIVVFTDGTDHAARVSRQEMTARLEGTDYAMYAIGVGNEIDDATLRQIGRDRYIRVEDHGALALAFRQIGDRIVALTRRYYLLSYCSPARAGAHRVTIEASSDGDSGSLAYDFNAAGFGPGCDPTHPPPFDTDRSLRKQARAERAHKQERALEKVETDGKASEKAEQK